MMLNQTEDNDEQLKSNEYSRLVLVNALTEVDNISVILDTHIGVGIV